MDTNTSGSQKKKSKKTKQKIISCFLSLMAGKKWDKISVKELCSASGITRSTFYQYYDDIYDLMESLENSLLKDLAGRYDQIIQPALTPVPPDYFLEKFNYSPPEAYLVWFEFCRDHFTAMEALLNRQNGDPYFISKLKKTIAETINAMMDQDGQPRDSLRSHFVRIFLELHLLAAQTWISEGEDHFLSVDDIVNLLNTMRVGSCYLNYKRKTDPAFKEIIGADAVGSPSSEDNN